MRDIVRVRNRFRVEDRFDNDSLVSRVGSFFSVLVLYLPFHLNPKSIPNSIPNPNPNLNPSPNPFPKLNPNQSPNPNSNPNTLANSRQSSQVEVLVLQRNNIGEKGLLKVGPVIALNP
jgi:hypothetical protein